MADCTLAQVNSLARSVLNDTDIPGGEIFVDSVLLPHHDQAYRELYNAMSTMQIPDINRVVYWVVQPNTTYLSPQGQMGLNDFNEPVFVEERGGITVVSIATTGTTSPVTVTTTTAHGLADGQSVTIQAVSGTFAPWGRFYITVIDATSFYLISSLSDGVAGTGGTVCYSQNPFTEVIPLLRTTDRAESDLIYDYMWQDNALQFRGANTLREIRITYRASGNPPTSLNAQLNLDDSLGYLGYRTAALAAQQKQWVSTYERLCRLACGPSMLPDGTGGLLRSYVNNAVVAMQRNRRQRQPFRWRRNAPDWYLL